MTHASFFEGMDQLLTFVIPYFDYCRPFGSTRPILEYIFPLSTLVKKCNARFSVYTIMKLMTIGEEFKGVVTSMILHVVTRSLL